MSGEKKRKVGYASADSVVPSPSVVWDKATRLAQPENDPVLTNAERFEIGLKSKEVVRILANPVEYNQYLKQYSADDIVQMIFGDELSVGISCSGDGGWHDSSFSLSFSRKGHKAVLDLRSSSLNKAKETDLDELFSTPELGVKDIEKYVLTKILKQACKKWVEYAIKVVRADLDVHNEKIDQACDALTKEEQNKKRDEDDGSDEESARAPLLAVNKVLNSALYSLNN